MKKSNLKTSCSSTSIFLQFWIHFGCFWEALGPLLGRFGRPKCAPRGWGTLAQDNCFSTFFVFAAALSIFFDLGRFGDDFRKLLEGFGMVLEWFGEGFWVDLRVWCFGMVFGYLLDFLELLRVFWCFRNSFRVFWHFQCFFVDFWRVFFSGFWGFCCFFVVFRGFWRF